MKILLGDFNPNVGRDNIYHMRETLIKDGKKQHLIADSYNLNILLDHETRKEYQIDVANRFSALEGLEILR